MKFQFDREWILAMVELQGDISDPTPYRPAEGEEAEALAACGVARGEASGATMHAASGSRTSGTSARGSSRSGFGGGSMSC